VSGNGGPLDGVKVIELAQWVFVPAATALLAELGADVIRLEHPTHGDPYRALTTAGVGNATSDVSARSAQVNRGKRSIGVDLAVPEGKAIAVRLIADADVFVTSLRVEALTRLGMSSADLCPINPRLVYARGDAFGPLGADSGRPGYDITAFWARGGIGGLVTDPDAPDIARQPPAFGDRIASLGLALGVVAALFERLAGGPSRQVTSSLLGAAAWVAASDLVSIRVDEDLSRLKEPPPPLTTSYRCADGRFLIINLMQTERYWADFCAATGDDRLGADPRFADSVSRGENAEELRDSIARLIGSRTLTEWRDAFAAYDLPWSPVQTMTELAFDPQVEANRFLADVRDVEGMRLVRAPFTIDDGPETLPRSPELGEHTESILLENGWSWADIDGLKSAGAIL
jgi:crotonobetainyl-CoA:carnitine CoA-transferase CaiB-like acyl-CoA transferase